MDTNLRTSFSKFREEDVRGEARGCERDPEPWEIISNERRGREEERSEESEAEFVNRRPGPFCRCAGLSNDTDKLCERVSRRFAGRCGGGLHSDGHAQRRDAFIDQPPYARQRPFYFSADGYVENSPGPLSVAH